MSDIIRYLPILVLNFNLYGAIYTVRTPHCKGLVFVKGVC